MKAQNCSSFTTNHENNASKIIQPKESIPPIPAAQAKQKYWYIFVMGRGVSEVRGFENQGVVRCMSECMYVCTRETAGAGTVCRASEVAGLEN